MSLENHQLASFRMHKNISAEFILESYLAQLVILSCSLRISVDISYFF